MSLPELTTWETEPLLQGYDPELKEGEFKIAPAKWIWLPGERTLPNTFVFFRKEFDLEKLPRVARGWIAADSRYVLYINGIRVQFGPAPHDPRHAEADPLDVAKYLRIGKNVIGVHVLFYGQGDGTWPTGKPGFIFRLNLGREVIASDDTWLCAVDRAHRPGQHKRWYLRALQEDYDATQFIHGWNDHSNRAKHWYKAAELETSSTASAFSGSISAYNEDIHLADTNRSTLRGRSIPMMHEEICKAEHILSHQVYWKGPVEDWFDFRVPGLFKVESIPTFSAISDGSVLLTYELPFGMVGWPIITFDHAVPEGGVMEVMVQESRKPDEALMDTHLFAWSRFRLSKHQQQYEPFDYESCRYIQIHLFIPEGSEFELPRVNFRRRVLLKSDDEYVRTDGSALDKLLLASTITAQNSAQDIVVDGMARERQQYGGDGGHQLHAVRQAFGESSLSARYLRQFGYGQMLNGVWFDSWPAFDRYARIAQRQIGASSWGSLVDHSIGFVIEHVNHWLQTGDRGPYERNRTRINRFLDYLHTITGLDGLLRVEDIGAETVWMDHDAYYEQGHKKLAFNLFAMQMQVMVAWIEGVDCDLSFQINAIRKSFWHEKFGALINNKFDVATRPARYCDRSISHLLWLHAHGYDVAPDLDKAIELLTGNSKSLGISYPANSVWRHWAWASIGRVDLIFDEFRTRWADMYSVQNNRTIQEMWEAKPGTTAQMSHCAVSPTIMMHQAILGIGQDREGKWFIRPQLGDLNRFSIRSHTPWGVLKFFAENQGDFHLCSVTIPPDMPLSIRTVRPLDLPNQSLGHEFNTDVVGELSIVFNVFPYPRNELIAEFDTKNPLQ